MVEMIKYANEKEGEGMEDAKIIQLYWERKESAITQTKQKYGKSMEQLAYHLLFDRQDTEECCSDTYWELWNALPPNRPTRLKAFIMRICRCNAINRLEKKEAKKRKCVMVELTKELEETIPDHTLRDAATENELAMYIQEYLKGLPSNKRILFVRRYWYGDSIRELAVMFHMTQSNVKVSLLRMREELKENLVRQEII
jgi:RNA polymerase sigma factor (sigma-70 family)